MKDVIAQMCQYTTCKVGLAIKEAQADEAIHKGVVKHVIVGTPGTMFDLLKKTVINPRHIKVFVLDEADNMLEKGSMADQTMRVKK